MKKRSSLILGILMTLMQIASTAHAEQYLYLPESRLYLGGGYNPFYPREGYRECIEHSGIRPVDTTGAAKANVTLSLVKSREQLYSMLHFSMSLAGSYMFASGSASLRIDNEDTFDSDSLTWIVLFEQNYGRYVLTNPKVREEFKRLHAADVYRACGSEVVTEATKSSMVYALVTVKHLTESHKRDLEASFGGSMSGGIWSAGMEGHFHSLLKTAMELTQVHVEIKAIGGKGISDLSDVVGGKNGDLNSYINYGNIPNVLNSYLKGMNAENAVPTQFTTTHISKFLTSINQDYIGFRSRQVEYLYNRYLAAEDVLNKIDQILTGEGRAGYIVDTNSDARLKTSRTQYATLMNKLNSAGEACFDKKSKNCDLVFDDLPDVNWPERNHNYFCKRKRIEAYQASLIPPGLMDVAEQHNLSPLIEIQGDRAALTGWRICSEED